MTTTPAVASTTDLPPIPDRLVALTFDDGPKSQAIAVALRDLARYVDPHRN